MKPYATALRLFAGSTSAAAEVTVPPTTFIYFFCVSVKAVKHARMERKSPSDAEIERARKKKALQEKSAAKCCKMS